MLAKMLRVTRVTVTKWFSDKIIMPQKSSRLDMPDPYYLLEQLKVIKARERNESK